MNVEKIIRIIMERDGLSYMEASQAVNDAREAIIEAASNEDYEEAEEIMYGHLGLEMDYLFDLI